MSGKIAKESWVEVFSYGDVNANELTDRINDEIKRGAEAIQIVFPDCVDSAKSFAQQIARLLSNSNWYLDARTDLNDGKSFAIGLRFTIPSSNYVSWVLGLGDFDYFPNTRRAPFPALIFRTGPPGRAPEIASPEKPRPGSDSSGGEPVHLADHPTIPAEPERVRRMWKQTQKLKSEVLKGDPNSIFAKAKVTACFPLDLRYLFELE